jgi:hypothetical protein
MRYDKIGNVAFVLLNLSCNVFGYASMILTGSQLIYGTLQMHCAAATILIPLGGKIPASINPLQY